MTHFTKSDDRILNLVYNYPGIKLTELIKKARISSATAKIRINNLLNSKVIKEEKIFGGKKILLRRFYPNFSTEEGKHIFSLVEINKRHEFFNKNKALIGPFKQLLDNIDYSIKVILVFGSFASNSQTKDSDLDILFLVKGKLNENNLKKEIERSFVTFNHELSPRIDSIDNFKKNRNKGIYETILKNHVIVKGALEFIELIS